MKKKCMVSLSFRYECKDISGELGGGGAGGGSTALHVSNEIATGVSILSTQPLSAPLPPPHTLTHIDRQIATLLGIYWPLHTS